MDTVRVYWLHDGPSVLVAPAFKKGTPISKKTFVYRVMSYLQDDAWIEQPKLVYREICVRIDRDYPLTPCPWLQYELLLKKDTCRKDPSVAYYCVCDIVDIGRRVAEISKRRLVKDLSFIAMMSSKPTTTTMLTPAEHKKRMEAARKRWNQQLSQIPSPLEDLESTIALVSDPRMQADLIRYLKSFFLASNAHYRFLLRFYQEAILVTLSIEQLALIVVAARSEPAALCFPLWRKRFGDAFPAIPDLTLPVFDRLARDIAKYEENPKKRKREAAGAAVADAAEEEGARVTSDVLRVYHECYQKYLSPEATCAYHISPTTTAPETIEFLTRNALLRPLSSGVDGAGWYIFPEVERQQELLAYHLSALQKHDARISVCTYENARTYPATMMAKLPHMRTMLLLSANGGTARLFATLLGEPLTVYPIEEWLAKEGGGGDTSTGELHVAVDHAHFIDMAVLVRFLERMAAFAHERKVRIMLVGDPHEHPGVRAEGRVFRSILEVVRSEGSADDSSFFAHNLIGAEVPPATTAPGADHALWLLREKQYEAFADAYTTTVSTIEEVWKGIRSADKDKTTPIVFVSNEASRKAWIQIYHKYMTAPDRLRAIEAMFAKDVPWSTRICLGQRITFADTYGQVIGCYQSLDESRQSQKMCVAVNRFNQHAIIKLHLLPQSCIPTNSRGELDPHKKCCLLTDDLHRARSPNTMYIRPQKHDVRHSDIEVISQAVSPAFHRPVFCITRETTWTDIYTTCMRAAAYPTPTVCRFFSFVPRSFLLETILKTRSEVPASGLAPKLAALLPQ